MTARKACSWKRPLELFGLLQINAAEEETLAKLQFPEPGELQLAVVVRVEVVDPHDPHTHVEQTHARVASR